MSDRPEPVTWHQPNNLTGAAERLTSGFHKEAWAPEPPSRAVTYSDIRPYVQSGEWQVLDVMQGAASGALLGGVIAGNIDKEYYFEGMGIGALAGAVLGEGAYWLSVLFPSQKHGDKDNDTPNDKTKDQPHDKQAAMIKPGPAEKYLDHTNNPLTIVDHGQGATRPIS
jgi:hypothetical protein